MWRRLLVPLWYKTCRPDVTLDQILFFAVNHVPYYRQFAGYRGLHDFPLLTKEIIRARFEDLISDDIVQRTWFYNTSGGSTGEPIRFVQDVGCARRGRWMTLEMKRWAGYRPGDYLVKLWGEDLDKQPRLSFKGRIAKWLSNVVTLNTFLLDEARIQQYVQIIRRRPPRLLVGYASSLYEISRYVLAHEIEIRGIGAIVSAAGTLYPQMRQTMEHAFGCNVFNRYGSREVGAIAAEDGTGQGLRVCPTVHVETVRPDESPCDEGETGDIVVTSLVNFAMPLIRYRIGDVGILKRCDCQPYLEKVVGRTVELFRTKEGKVIDGEYFTHLLYFRDWVRTFRFRQVELDRVVIEIVLASAGEPPGKELAEVERDVKRVMGEDARVDWSFVDQIQPLPSGKYIYTLCEVG